LRLRDKISEAMQGRFVIPKLITNKSCYEMNEGVDRISMSMMD